MKLSDFRILFYLIWLIPALIAFYAWALRKRDVAMRAFADIGLIRKITIFYDQRTNAARAALNVMAAAMIILALAKPQWGSYWKENDPKGVDIVIAIDVSKSMLATDILPSRLEFAKFEISDFIKRLKNDRVGLIAFSGNAFLQCPLTAHYNGFMLTLQGVDVDIIEKGGTAIASAIDEAIKSYRGAKTNDKVLIIITDGENIEGGLDDALGRAKKDRIKIFCIGIGTKEGAPLPLQDSKEGMTYLKDSSGNVVKSRLDEVTLQKIASATGGEYIHATQQDFGLDYIYKKHLSGLEKIEIKGNMVKAYKERFQVPLGLAAIFLLAGLMIGQKNEDKKI